MKTRTKKYVASMLLMFAMVLLMSITVNAATVKTSNLKGNCEPYDANHAYITDVSMGGISYTDALYMYSWNNGGLGTSTSYATFNLQGQYVSMSFVMGRIEGCVNTKDNPTLNIYADNKLIKSAEISATALPQPFKIDLTGVYQLRIEMIGMVEAVGWPEENTKYALGAINLVSNGILREISLDQETLTLSKENPSCYLTPQFIPLDARNQSVTWKSSNTDVATVNSSGLVTGVAKGTCEITATSKDGSYTATCKVTNNMPYKFSLGSVAVSLSQTSYTYSGQECRPSVTVKYNGNELREGSDFTVSYSDNTKVGTASVTITGTGDYTGKLTKKFKIKAIKAKTLTLSATSYTYNGKVRKPAVTLTDENGDVISSKYYTITWPKGRINVGTYKVTVECSGNYTGTLSKTFKIVKASQTITVKSTGKSYTAKALAKKSASFSIGAAAKTKCTYVSSNKKYVTVTSAGKVTVKKGTPKGTYKIVITAEGSSNYKKATKTIKIIVK